MGNPVREYKRKYTLAGFLSIKERKWGYGNAGRKQIGSL